MQMVSLKRYLSANEGENSLRQSISLLVEKMGSAAVEADGRELDDFRAEVNGIHEAVVTDLPPENIANLVESACRSCEIYNRRITKTIGRQSSEFQTIIRMLQESIVRIAGDNNESVQALIHICEDIERGGGFRDLQLLKAHLGSCLSGLREEIEREKLASRSLIEKLQIEIERGRAPVDRDRQSNSPYALGATGQPGAESDLLTALQGALDRGTRHYALVMVVNRWQPVTARFGKDAGNRMLKRFQEHMESQLDPGDRLLRLNGPAMVAILERPQSFDQVRALARRILDVPIQDTYEFSGRSVLIPISAAWSVNVLAVTPEATEKQIHKFIASQGCRDFA